MENPAYQTVYGVSLLDDIHNYFPALLYDHGRFQTLQTVFSYVRHQMNTRFNLYSYGASLAGTRVPSSSFSPAHAHAHAREPVVEEDIFSSIANISLLLNLLQPPQSGRSGLPGLSGLSGLPGLSGRSGIPGIPGMPGMPARSDFMPASSVIRTRAAPDAGVWAAFRDPVIVAPSQEVLAANTQLILGSDLSSNTVCSVCQDSIIPSEACRRIIACQHTYHRVCIDQWFTRSVFCPSCRHDIRITSPRLQASATPVSSLPPLASLPNPVAPSSPSVSAPSLPNPVAPSLPNPVTPSSPSVSTPSSSPSSSSDETLFQTLGFGI